MPNYIRKIGLLGAALALVVFSGSTAVAMDGQSDDNNTDSVNSGRSQPPATTDGEQQIATDQSGSGDTSSTSQDGQGDHGERGPQGSATKLAAVKLKVCENRQTNINRLMNHVVTREQNQLDFFDTFAQKIETFVTNKNLTVSNYSQLVISLQTDQTKATSDLETLKATGTFECGGSDPKGAISTFKTDLRQEVTDLKTYKPDLKSLLTAVKTAAGDSTNTATSEGSN